MGTLTITTTAAQDARLVAAYGRKLRLGYNETPPAPRNATAAEVKAEIIRMIKQDVAENEMAAARIAAEAGVPDLGSVS
ncbi:MAG: hypothetical protein RLZZ601_2157 [Pseudomonadota bacterium]